MQKLGRRCLVVHILQVVYLVVCCYVADILRRARRNEKGHLEPDAPDDVVQASQGFAGYEHAPKAEVRNKTTTA